ncbi:MAG: 4-diphosphocytidyl-2-C-methyl-D-erythritol kinase [Gammaproteobacteria bacterium]|nr:4-diphosphocytidyl-2-C-methyl-D-erythritol kinase [Gammaproteobacteria bacterium]
MQSSDPTPDDTAADNAYTRSWPAPAKLNLFLHVVGRRPDGYHLLQTVFQFLDFADELDFHIRPDRGINLSSNYHHIEPDQDLIVRAARHLQEYSGSKRGVDITVRKQLPFGGGLGGGSSNAATTLVALNQLWELGLAVDQLAAIGLQLGADVPVFVRGQTAWAEGVGEKLTPINLPEPWFLVANPGVTVSTAEIFNAPDLTRTTPAITIRAFLAGTVVHNDCEAVVRKTYPKVANLLNWMEETAPARMTGTGACGFSAYATREQAEATLTALPAPWWGFVARGRNQSPLLDKLDRVRRGAGG